MLLGEAEPESVDSQMAGAERLKAEDKTRTIVSARAKAPATLALRWSDGTSAKLDLSGLLREKHFQSLRTPVLFEKARVGEWGHSVEWPSGAQLGAETLWLETLSASGHADAREFLEWRLRHGLSLSGTANALGISRRMVAYYSNGDKPLPRPILLACKGWEVSHAA
jgi:hypothetical protein